MSNKMLKIAQFVNDTLELVQNFANYPVEVMTEVNRKYRLLEREVEELALASGMNSNTYQQIWTDLVQKGAGDAIQVLEMMKMVFTTLGNTINFQDPVNINAVFGGMQKVNDNKGGIGLQKWLKEELLPTIQKTREMGINPKQITSLINNSVSNNINADVNKRYIDMSTGEEVPYINIIKSQDGQLINKDTGENIKVETTLVDVGTNQQDILNIANTALAKGSENWEDVVGWKGNALKNTMDYTQGLRKVTTPISMRPDDQQKMQALTERELAGLNQEKLRFLLGLEQGMTPGTLLAIEDARKALETGATLVEPAARALNIIPQTSAYIGQTVVDPLKYISNPEAALSSGSNIAKNTTASSKKKLIKIADIPNQLNKKKLIKIAQIPQGSYTYDSETIEPFTTDEFRPQPQSGISAWQQDVAQTDTTSSAAAQARMLEWASILGDQLTGQIMQIESSTSMLEQHFKQFESGLANMDNLSRQGVTDQNIIQEIQPTIQELLKMYNILIGEPETGGIGGLYGIALNQIYQQIQTALQGDQSLMSGVLSKFLGFKNQLETKIQDVVYKQKQLNVDMVTLVNRMKARIQEAVVSDTLQKETELLESTIGSTVARGELAASQAAEAKYYNQAARDAEALGSGVSPVVKARLQQKALEKSLKSLKNLEMSGQSTTDPDTSIQMLGI